MQHMMVILVTYEWAVAANRVYIYIYVYVYMTKPKTTAFPRTGGAREARFGRPGHSRLRHTLSGLLPDPHPYLNGERRGTASFTVVTTPVNHTGVPTYTFGRAHTYYL
jgi:hypothetical protein